MQWQSRPSPPSDLRSEQIAGREHGLLTKLVVGVIGALVGGFVFGFILGFRYDEGSTSPPSL
jgi:uncharacterized membrane protein YeaQ/YmgE (transglycosylase-associated protein family)